jgi:Rps23 Pro-64 3,4-dihydroxylase Tpa1-like proline 4-hydroxylase
MTATESLDHLSEVLLDDERIVSLGEREFLADLLRRSNNQPPGSSPAVTQTIAKIAGEIVMERAYGVMGNAIVRRLAERTDPYPQPDLTSFPSARDFTSGPQRRDLLSDSRLSVELPPVPPTPGPPGPGPHGISMAETTDFANPDGPPRLPVRYAVLEEFLAPAELNQLISYTLEHEAEFKVSEVISPGLPARGEVKFEYRRSRVLMNLGKYQSLITDRIRQTLPRVLPKLEIEPFPVAQTDIQITASNDGDFFHWHSDNALPEVARRHVTFVYFFHREPKAFQGGELRLYDSARKGSGYAPAGNYFTLVPQQNHVVLFNSSLAHEITPVACESRQFADSRFTVNGWVCR